MKKETRKGIKGIERQNQIEQGFFDGRFRTKSVKSEKEYSRKAKHKNQSFN